MRFYFAPLEGITGYIFRNAHHNFFTGMDKYYAPFMSPAQNCVMNPKERRDILPEHNRGIPLVPQILANNADYFTQAEKELRLYGYEEVNLNLGCPSRTVVTKKKGAGFLACPDELDMFLEQIFSHAQGDISIKTRIGMESEEEFYDLLAIYNKYPVKELIIHPRTQNDYYKNGLHLNMIAYAAGHSKNPLCYNGDLCSVADYERIAGKFPSLSGVMMGRGLLTNPALVMEIRGNTPADKDTLRRFHDKLYQDYAQVFSGEKNVLFKMKELWLYMAGSFDCGESYIKKIKKVQRKKDYENIVNALFAEG